MRLAKDLFIHGATFGTYLSLLMFSLIWLSTSALGASAEAIVATLITLPFVVLLSHVSFNSVQSGVLVASKLVSSFVIRVVLLIAEKERKWTLLNRTGHAAPAEN